MGKMRFLTVLIPAVAIVTALSLPAAAQSGPGGTPTKGTPGHAPPAKAAPHGPAAGAHPGPGPRPAGRPAYAGRPGPGYAGRPAYYARHPDFARRGWHGHFYRGALAWDRGVWRHEMRNGRYGWWWDVGGAWYFYEQPVYPYPAVISDVEVLEDPAMADAPPLDEDAYPEPAPVVVAPAPVIVAPPPIVCVGPFCVR